MKIIHIITGLYIGGAERALYNLLNGGLAGHFDCHVISMIDEGTIGPQIKALQVPVTTLGMRRGRPSFSSLVKLRKAVRKIQPDIIQGWMYHGNLAATLACTFASERPVLAWNIRQTLYDLSYEKWMTRKVIKLNRFFSSSPDILLYNSHLSHNQHEDFGFASQHGQVIPNGIDVKRYTFSSAQRQLVRTELGIPEEARVVGHVARFHRVKDHSMLLGAVTALALRHPDTHYILVGKDVSLDNTSLVQLIPTQMLDRFHLLGERSDVPELMSAMDIFCLSSAWGEGFPNVIGEAMAVGLPCVATDVGDSALIIEDAGVIVPARDEKAFVSGIESLLLMSSEERCALGTNARARIEANYTLDAIVEQYAALYEQMMIAKGVC